MSQFDCYTQAEYVEKLRIFLRMEKQGFLRREGLVANPEEPRKGRLPSYPLEAVRALEDAANLKASRCEMPDTTFGERFKLARDYRSSSNAEVGKAMGVSRELVRLWSANLVRPASPAKLAEFLKVPEVWLKNGEEGSLPANSHIGLRFGEDARNYREKLFGMTSAAMADFPDGMDLPEMRVQLERLAMTKPLLAQTARRSGGRWQAATAAAGLLFAPWIPIKEHGLSRRDWSDEVEALIKHALESRPTVYGALHLLRAKCEAKGLDYPKLITLQKRVQTEKRGGPAQLDRESVFLSDLSAGF